MRENNFVSINDMNLQYQSLKEITKTTKKSVIYFKRGPLSESIVCSYSPSIWLAKT